VKVARLIPGERSAAPPGSLIGAVLAQDLLVAGARWSKGRRLSEADLAELARGDVRRRGPRAGSLIIGPPEVTVLIPEPDELHEDEAAVRLAAALAGPCLEVRGPRESRIDLLAAGPGAVRVRAGRLEQINRIDGLSVFTLFDGQLVAAGTLVASVKTGPHVVPIAGIRRAEVIARAGGPVVDVRPYAARRVGVIVNETMGPAGRARFEASLAPRVTALGSSLVAIVFVADDAGHAEHAFRRFLRGADRADVILTAGVAFTDPRDPILVAFAAIGGRIVSHGVPAHPGSMLWLGRAGRTSVMGLPSCASYSRRSAADLVLPWLLAGEPASRATIARLGHGGVLTGDMRFRFAPSAR
jgi:hypothetical protein